MKRSPGFFGHNAFDWKFWSKKESQCSWKSHIKRFFQRTIWTSLDVVLNFSGLLHCLISVSMTMQKALLQKLNIHIFLQLFVMTIVPWHCFFSQYNEVEAITVYCMTYNIYKQYTSIHDICGFCFVIEWEINKVACNTLYVTWSALMWFKTEFPLPGSIWQMLSAPMHNEFDCMLSGSNQGVSVSFEHNVHNTVHVICICFIWAHTLCIFLGRGPWFTACPLIIMHQCRANLNSNTAT